MLQKGTNSTTAHRCHSHFCSRLEKKIFNGIKIGLFKKKKKKEELIRKTHFWSQPYVVHKATRFLAASVLASVAAPEVSPWVKLIVMGQAIKNTAKGQRHKWWLSLTENKKQATKQKEIVKDARWHTAPKKGRNQNMNKNPEPSVFHDKWS